MTREWRNCRASLVLIGEINALWPDRDTSSDGTIGDAAHASRASDHNPWVVVDGEGVVRARDIDKDGIPAAALAEHLRVMGERRDPRLYPGGYVIFNRRITSPDFTEWREYTGTNPHTGHIHTSFALAAAGFDSTTGWNLAAQFGRPIASLTRPATEGDDLVQTFEWPAGVSAHKLVCPVGSASQLVDRAWLSLACDGEISKYDVWFQGDQGGLKDFHGSIARDRRMWWELPSGTTQIVIHVVATGPVGACLETKPR